jgi:translation initiation factor IF-2
LRVHELSRELGVPSRDILQSLEAMGFEGRTASSTVPDEAVPRIRASGGRVRPGSKPRTATEEQLPRRRPAAEAPEAPASGPDGEADGAALDGAGVAPAAAAGTDAGAAAVGDGASSASDGSAAARSASGDGGVAVAIAPEPIRVARGATAQELADRLGVPASEVVKTLFAAGEMVSITQSLTDAAIELAAAELGHDVQVVSVPEEAALEVQEEPVDETKLQPRPPVVTVMGHVDHGKTLLLDAIRKSDVVAGEFGGITQHIGAYQVHRGGRTITFIDTPGHEAFTAMRARGAEATDIVVLVIAADDGVMPQTVEALSHARAAGVPIVVAVNKIDKEEADPQRVRQQLVERSVVPVEWGGDYEFVDVSARTGQNLDNLLETVGLVADIQELRADPEAHPRGVVLEAHLDRGRGAIATVLIDRGTLRAGDSVVAGSAYARIRAMFDENMQAMTEAGPSKPAQVLGWSQVPQAGDDFRWVADEREARRIAQERETRARASELAAARQGASLADLLMRARTGELPTLNLILKADVQGSLGAIEEALGKLPQDEVRVGILHGGVGGISENDVSLAAASDAIVVGFNVRPDPGARELAEKEGVDIRTYRVIYQALDDIKDALSGMLSPEQREVELGRAEVRAVFRTPRGVVAGCMITQGTITRNSLARLVRDGAVIWTGRVGSLRRFKDDVREVSEGYECGIGLEGYQDIHDGDVIETYEVRETARTLA